jgi:hypothetical protein
MNDSLNNQAQQIWQSQPVEGTQMSTDVIRQRAVRFERKISRRNLRESIAGLFAIAGFSYFFVTTPGILLRVTWALFIAGMIWVIIQLRRKGTPKTMPAMMGSSTSVDFFRSELERQRDVVKNVWPWYLAPLVPGYIALNVAYVFAFPRARWAGFAVLDVIFVAIFVGVWKMNHRAARCLQRTIDELSTAEKR